MKTIGESLGIPPSTVTPCATLSDDRLGIELELEGIIERPELAWWNVIEDGSLRNNGAEFVLRRGYGGLELSNAIDELFTWLNGNPWEASFRCSTHFHIDMTDFNLDQVAKFILLYSTKESELFDMIDSNRKHSNFCVPIGMAMPFYKRVMQNLIRVLSQPHIGQKYTALNVLPLTSQGTLEYRGAGAILDKTTMIHMARTLQDMKQRVRASGGQSAEEFLNGTVGEYTPDTLNAYSLLKSYVEGPRNPIFTSTATAFDDLVDSYRGIGTREAFDSLFGIISNSTSVRVETRAAPRDSSAFGNVDGILRTFLSHGITSHEKGLLTRGLQCTVNNSMQTLWNNYYNLTVRTKNRSLWRGAVALSPVMKLHEIVTQGVSEEFIWLADQDKYNRFLQARYVIRSNNKIVPMQIDGAWVF